MDARFHPHEFTAIILSCIRALVHGAVASDVCIGLGGVTEAGRIASPRFYDHGASQTTMRDFIPFKNELIFSRIHKISVRLVIDPTNDPARRRYDQADIVGIRYLNRPLAAGEECSSTSSSIGPFFEDCCQAPTWSAGDALEDIWT